VAEALTLIERKSPQVVLMDYHLLDGDGDGDAAAE
jgi:CheY-like chemotaxis protein